MKHPTTSPPSKTTALLHQDSTRQLHRALTWAVDSKLFAALPVHGNTSWTFPQMLLLTLFWVWSEVATLSGAFAHARQLAGGLLGPFGLSTYSGFISALTTWSPQILPVFQTRLHQRMETVAGKYWRIGQWLALAVDGSRTTTPRTRKNEQAFNRDGYGQGKKARSRRKWKNKRRRSKPLGQPVHPQIWLTLVWHMGLKLPWTWRCGPSYASERQHVVEILQTQQFPDKTLFCGDAGFVGYDFWKAMIDRRHHFLMRVGGNIRLLRQLGDTRVQGDLVHVWPKTAMAKQQPPLPLRLLTFRTGRCLTYAVTSVLSEHDLTPDQARQLYAKRWGVELQFRALKQTFGRRNLHSRTPERAYVELEWSLVGLWLVQLLTVSEQIPVGLDPGNARVSVAVQVVRDAMRRCSTCHVKKGLRVAVKDAYHRRSQKKSRYHPGLKEKPSAQKPKIMTASASQRRNYRHLLLKQ